LPKTKTKLKWENKGQRDVNWAKNRKILNYKCSFNISSLNMYLLIESFSENYSVCYKKYIPFEE